MRIPESLKSFHKLFDTYLDYMLAKFEANRMVRNVQNVELFDRHTHTHTHKTKQNKNKTKTKTKQNKSEIFKIIFDKTLTPFCKKNNCL